jgi:hypothetical protein
MMLIKKYSTLIVGVLIGGIAGYAYYYWIGCTSGSCPITSQPVNSTLYGALMGGLIVNMFNKK